MYFIFLGNSQIFQKLLEWSSVLVENINVTAYLVLNLLATALKNFVLCNFVYFYSHHYWSSKHGSTTYKVYQSFVQKLLVEPVE